MQRIFLSGAHEQIRCTLESLSKTVRLRIGSVVHRVSNGKFDEKVADGNICVNGTC